MDTVINVVGGGPADKEDNIYAIGGALVPTNIEVEVSHLRNNNLFEKVKS